MSALPIGTPQDFAQTYTESVPSQSVVEVIDQAAELQTLPVMLFEADSIIRDPHSGAGDLAALLEKDTALATRILRIANSAYYGSRRRIASLPQAIVLLGFQAIKNITLTIKVVETLKPLESIEFDFPRFWGHSLGVAIASDVIARQADIDDAGDAYMAGLLHDLGRLLVAQHAAPSLQRVLELQQDGHSIDEAEKQVWGVGHAGLGARFLHHWDLPPVLVDAVRFHHSPGEPGSLSDVIQLSDIVCSALGLGCPGAPFPAVTDSLNRRLGYDDEILAAWMTPVSEQIQAAQEFFELVGHGPVNLGC